MRLASSPARGMAVGVLVILLTLQAMPLLVASASSSAGTGLSSAASTKAPSIASTPDYLILGQLHGTTVTQSLKPRSVPLLGGYQFAATQYTAKDLQGAYGVTSMLSSGYNGAGETIAIIDAYGDPTIQQDLATFDAKFNLPPVDLTVIPVGPYQPSLGVTTGWDAETALDVEAAHAMAPAAHINLLVAANSSNALMEAIQVVVTRHLGNVVSMSWGLGENTYGESGFSAAGYLNYAYADYWFQVGAAEGISFFSSSGDLGAYDGSTVATADFPSSSPFVTGVGGTTLYITPTSGSLSALNSSATYAGESAWSISPQYPGQQVSSGGGYSHLFAQPYYQAGAVSSATRTVPDVAADANPYTGFVIVLEGGEYIIGGTSLSSPLWAGMTAVMDQYVGRSLGALNPYLYSIYANKAEYGSAFNQVTFGYNGAYQSSPGYNLVTGLGSPNLPALAADIKSASHGLSVSVATGRSSSPSAPAQYSFGDTITVGAAVKTPSGATASTGSFTAKAEGPGGVIATFPLSFNGTRWVGTLTAGASDPAGSWTVTVSGTSGGYSGDGIADVNVGNSLAIFLPGPYPYLPPVVPNSPFEIVVYANDPSGVPIGSAALTAYLRHSGTVVESIPLVSFGGGFFGGLAEIPSSAPQGTYTLVVSEPSFGSVYSYFYVGQAVVGAIYTPTQDAIPSASPGQQVTFLAQTTTASGTGAFSSNVTAKVFSLSGSLMATVPLAPAPNTVQFGVYNFFGLQQANFTIPSSFTPGFYNVEFLSSYAGNRTAGVQLGNFTTGFYVSGPPLGYQVSHASAVYEGQDVVVTAKITDSSGAPVTSGVFLATVIPAGYAYEALATNYYGYTGVSMQYDQAMGEWVGSFQIPSALTSPNFWGNAPALLAGPWTVFVAGESSSAANVIPTTSTVTVLPYTSYGPADLTPSNIGSSPLVTWNGTAYTLANVGTSSLSVSGVKITLSGDSIGNLTAVDSQVILDGSQVGAVNATGSNVTLTGGTQVGSLSLTSTPLTVREGSDYRTISPAPASISVTGLSGSVTGQTTFTVQVTGAQVVGSSLVATIDGMAVPLTVSELATGLTATGTVSPSAMPDGVHILTVGVSQSDGVSSTSTTYFGTQAKTSSLMNTVYIIAAVAVVALLLAAIALVALLTTRRKGVAKPTSAGAPQV